MRISIIITALNEPHIYKTLDDVVKTDKNITEVIVIDDNSDKPIEYNHEKVKIFRNQTREGLIRSRNNAAKLASGDYIISLDAHCKVEENWATYLAEQIDDFKVISVPSTSNLNVETWKSNNAQAYRIGIHWNLDFFWRDIVETEFTPIICGHCFCFTKEWFQKSGGFDVEMNKWGGENLELSIKTWLCGGSIKIARNAKVAHYFKPSWTYEMDGRTLLRNKARVAEVWLDEYKDYFYDSVNCQIIDYGDLTERLQYKRLQERDFKWFIDRLQPELGFQKFKNKHKGKTFAIIGSAPSLDKLDLSILQHFDVLIGINYNGLKIKSNYVLFHDFKPALQLLESGLYKPEQLMVPTCLKQGKQRVYATDINPDWSVYHLGPQDSEKPLKKKDGPFFNHASSVQTAAHIAAFMGAKNITLFGCDFKFSGSSHCEIPEYKNGFYWPDNNSTKSYLRRLQLGNTLLETASREWCIPIFRYGSL